MSELFWDGRRVEAGRAEEGSMIRNEGPIPVGFVFCIALAYGISISMSIGRRQHLANPYKVHVYFPLFCSPCFDHQPHFHPPALLPQNCSPSKPPNVLLRASPLPVSLPVPSPMASLSNLLLRASTCAPALRVPINHPGTLHPVPGNTSFRYACPIPHPTAAGSRECGNCDSASCSGST